MATLGVFAAIVAVAALLFVGFWIFVFGAWVFDWITYEIMRSR